MGTFVVTTLGEIFGLAEIKRLNYLTKRRLTRKDKIIKMSNKETEPMTYQPPKKKDIWDSIKSWVYKWDGGILKKIYK